MSLDDFISPSRQRYARNAAIGLGVSITGMFLGTNEIGYELLNEAMTIVGGAATSWYSFDYLLDWYVNRDNENKK